eukprot:jgi/Undpi1/9588/HiC_scaffold_27.g12044.m1
MERPGQSGISGCWVSRGSHLILATSNGAVSAREKAADQTGRGKNKREGRDAERVEKHGRTRRSEQGESATAESARGKHHMETSAASSDQASLPPRPRRATRFYQARRSLPRRDDSPIKNNGLDIDVHATRKQRGEGSSKGKGQPRGLSSPTALATPPAEATPAPFSTAIQRHTKGVDTDVNEQKQHPVLSDNTLASEKSPKPVVVIAPRVGDRDPHANDRREDDDSSPENDIHTQKETPFRAEGSQKKTHLSAKDIRKETPVRAKDAGAGHDGEAAQKETPLETKAKGIRKETLVRAKDAGAGHPGVAAQKETPLGTKAKDVRKENPVRVKDAGAGHAGVAAQQKTPLGTQQDSGAGHTEVVAQKETPARTKGAGAKHTGVSASSTRWSDDTGGGKSVKQTGAAAASNRWSGDTDVQNRHGAARGGGGESQRPDGTTPSAAHESNQTSASRTRRVRKTNSRREKKKNALDVSEAHKNRSSSIPSADKTSSGKIQEPEPEIASSKVQQVKPEVLECGAATGFDSSAKGERCSVDGKNAAEADRAGALSPPREPVNGGVSCTEAITKFQSPSPRVTTSNPFTEGTKKKQPPSLLPASADPAVGASPIASTAVVAEFPSTAKKFLDTTLQQSSPTVRDNAEISSAGGKRSSEANGPAKASILGEPSIPAETIAQDGASVPATAVATSHLATPPSSQSVPGKKQAVDSLLSPPVIPKPAAPSRLSQPVGGETWAVSAAANDKVPAAVLTHCSGGAAKRSESNVNGGRTPKVAAPNHANDGPHEAEDAKQPRNRQSNSSLRKQKLKQKRQQQQEGHPPLAEATTAAAVGSASEQTPANRAGLEEGLGSEASTAPQKVGSLVGGRGTAAAARGNHGVRSKDKTCPARVGGKEDGCSARECKGANGKGEEGVSKKKEGVLETVDVSGDIAEWAVGNSRGGEFTAMLETIRGASGALSVDTRVVLGQGSGNGGRPQMRKVHVDIRASTLAQARMAKALLVTHLKSRSELLRVEQSRRALEQSLSALEARF